MSNQAPRILFLTVPIGAGHVRAAQAVRDACADEFPDSVTELVDVFGFFPVWMGRTIISVYLNILRLFPVLYGKAYGWGNESAWALWGREIVNRLLAARCRDYIKRFAPDAIVCTHAFPAGLAAYLVREGAIKVPVLGIVTDFTVHRLWVYPELSGYFVAHDQLRDYLLTLGISRENSVAAGIPVAPVFAQRRDLTKLRQKLDLESDMPCVLIMGGGLGILPMDEIVRRLDELPGPLQLLVVAGANAGQFAAVSRQGSRHRIKVYGFVNNVHELMAVADLIISKPGGMSVAEALAEGLPLLIYRPLPGVERANAAFLVQQGVAEVADTPDDIVRLLSVCLDAERLNRRQEAARRLGKPGAARNIAAYIVEKYIL